MHGVIHTNILISALLALILVLPVRAYIPALPSNQSTDETPPSQNDSNWIIQLNWHPIGVFSDGINHQLRSDSANHSIFQGVLLHFSEFNATTQPPAVVPWIAMINCDSNSSTSSSQDDIFTMARDRGAAAAMLYSLTAHSCKVNPEYLQNFEKPLDVFSAGNLQGARLIESQFSNVLGAGYWFQSGPLNSSAPAILDQIKSLGLSNLTDSSQSPPPTLQPATSPLQVSSNNQSSHNSLSSAESSSSNETALARRSDIMPYHDSSSSSSQRLIARSSSASDHSSHLKLNMNLSRHSTSGSDMNASPVYLIATLANAEITGSLDQQKQDRNQSNNFQSTTGNNTNPNTGLAMIILYAITGCVSFMFLIVIVSGAIRAIRNPDRYGPRPGGRVNPQTGEEDPFAQPRQTRAAGLGKAILDTFPIVKFGRQRNDNKFDSEGRTHVSQDPKPTDFASPGEESIMMSERGLARPSSGSILPESSGSAKDKESDIGDETKRKASDVSWQIPLISESRLSTSSLSADPQAGNGESNSHAKSATDGTSSHHHHTNLDPNHHLTPAPLLDTANDNGDIGGELVDVNNSTTCPICVCDFEEDDDIRMLPCDARHQFHKECVDPWLLNESKFCPLCRWDLSTRKDGSKIITEVVMETESGEPSSPGSGQPTVSAHPEQHEPSALQASQSTSTSRAAGRDVNSSRLSRTLAPWLSLGHPASSSEEGRASPTASSRHAGARSWTNNLSSIIPHVRPRRSRQDDDAALDERDVTTTTTTIATNATTTNSRPSASNSQPTPSRHPFNHNAHDQATLDPTDDSGSKGRFHKYLAHIRRRKQPQPSPS
ncbi:hypothetical protein PCANC_03348 [Puccinia coronata f. sp. avenae]|uniref:RING-type domain-containing protein n=1 Tax=Puccinia coronata f. sp. avenae TaxID=200324 RepID=A0A2N5T8P9_9BASI|nr:hypothetical protein PCANC_03348 [Puccinia coronata f. sp. avenae]